MVPSVAFVLASLVAFAAAKPTRSSLVVHESRPDVPEGYVNTGPAPASATINMRVGLASKDFSSLEKILLDVSTPSSSKYGQHLSQAQVCLGLRMSIFSIAHRSL
jgi:tripeptidyl-peptidase-1